MRSKWLCVLLLVGMVVLMSGCSMSYVEGLNPQSHFDFPNSNIIPVGKATGSASDFKFLFGVPYPTSDLMGQAVQNALDSKGGDVLINYVGTYTMTDLILVKILTYDVDGTACKTELGMKKLM